MMRAISSLALGIAVALALAACSSTLSGGPHASYRAPSAPASLGSTYGCEAGTANLAGCKELN